MFSMIIDCHFHILNSIYVIYKTVWYVLDDFVIEYFNDYEMMMHHHPLLFLNVNKYHYY